MLEKKFLKLKIWISCVEKISLRLFYTVCIPRLVAHGLHNYKYEDDTPLILILLCLQCYVTHWGAVSHYWFKQQYLFRIIILSIIIFGAQNVFNMYALRTKCINACNCRY